MNWFIDMCILIFYAEVGGKNYQKAETFVKDKKDNNFFVCFYISKDNLPKWIKRQRLILKLASNKISNPNHDLEKADDFNDLYPQDKIKLMKLISASSSVKDKPIYIENVRRNQDLMLQRINFFLLKLIDKEVVPINEIDIELKSTLFTFLNNHSDSMTLASGIQYHQKDEVDIFTGDKKDWNKENIQWVYDSKPEFIKIYPKVPKIKYIQNY